MKNLQKLAIVLALAILLALSASTTTLVQERDKLAAENQQLQNKLTKETLEKKELAASLDDLKEDIKQRAAGVKEQIENLEEQIAESKVALAELREEFEATAKMLSQNVIDGPVLWAQSHESVARVVVPGGIGSAFVGPSNLLVTARHVIDSKDFITVTFPDGTVTEARVCGESAENDLAILRPVNPISQKALPLTDAFQTGQPVLLIGNQAASFLRSESIRKGTINAVYREAEGKIVTLPTGETPDTLIQYDAPTNPGDSGAPLLNSQGHVIGIASFRFPSYNDINIAIASTAIHDTIATCS